MPGDIPKRTTSGTRGGDAHNKMRDSVLSHQPLHAPGARVSHTVHGVFRESAETPAGGYANEETSGVSYEGEYDPLRVYTRGMMVRKTTGTHQGLYICNEDAPAKEAPVFPEPTSGIVFWHIFSLGIISTFEVTSDPTMNVKQVYVHASEPFI